MTFTKTTILICLLFTMGSSIKCVSEWKFHTPPNPASYNRDRTTCEGEYCLGYDDPGSFGMTDKDCASGFHQTMGCWTNRGSTVCACNTDLCNAVEMKALSVKQPAESLPTYKCHYYQYKPGEEVTEKQLNLTSPGTVCSVSISIALSSSECEIGRYSLNRLPVQLKQEVVFNFASFAKVGGVYAETNLQNQLVISYQCHGDFCNRHFDSEWITARGDVECHMTSVTNIETCSGEFCVYYHNPVSKGYTGVQTCLTMNQTVVDGNYSIGTYKAGPLTVYVCKGYYCNKDLESAKKWIEDYEKGLVHAGTPVYGKPFDVENLENTASQRFFSCVPNVVFFLSVSILHLS